MRQLAVMGVMAALMVAPIASAQTPQRAEVPIHNFASPTGLTFYSIPLTLGTAHVEALLDTGSSGLRVLSRALNAPDYATAQTPTDYAFGSGTRMTGVVATGALTLGGLTAPVQFALVQATQCTARIPDCPASKTSFAHFGVAGGGQPDQGLLGLIGVGLRKGDSVDNPLASLGVTSWIVDLPRPGETQGRLVLNPSAGELAGYTLFQLQAGPQGGWLDTAVPACVEDEATHISACAGAFLDSGAPGIRVGAPVSAAGFPEHSRAHLNFPHAGGDVSADFTLSEGPGTHVAVIDPGPMPQRLFLGTVPFALFSVFYDSGHGVIGLKPRA